MSGAAAGKRPLGRLEPFGKPFIFVTGKGGTGKTTVSAALALALSKRGRRVLLSTSDPKERLSRLLGSKRLNEQVSEIASNLWAVNIDARAALGEYGEMILKSGLLHRAVFDNRPVQSFLAAIPGVYQWAVLGKAWYHSTERVPGAGPRFDHVIFDAPATGHALQMLWVPKILTQVAHAGFLLKDAERAWAMLSDPAHTAFGVVALAEEGPVSETLELAARLRAELGLSVAFGVVNQVVRAAISSGERQRLQRLDGHSLQGQAQGSASERSQLRALVYRAAREAGQDINLERLARGLPLDWLRLPRALGDAGCPAGIDELSQELVDGN